MKNLSSKWQKCIVWLTGYLNTIAFFLAGGYVYLNTDDEDVKGSAKNVLVLMLGFTGLEILRSIIYNIFSIANNYEATSVLSDIALVFSIIKMVVFVVFFVLDLCGIKLSSVKKTSSKPTQQTTPVEKNDD